MTQNVNVYVLPVEIWQQNIYPYIEPTDFLNLMLSNKKLYKHLTKTKRSDLYLHSCLWDNFYQQIILTVQAFMERNFCRLKILKAFSLDDYQEILTICEIYRQTHEYLPNEYKRLERMWKLKLLNYLKSKDFTSSISDISGCLYDNHFLLLGTLSREFYENKVKMDAHIHKVVDGMKRAGMNQPDAFLKNFSNSMILDFGDHHQYLENILPKRMVDVTTKTVLNTHSKFQIRHSNLRYIDLYSLEKLMYYNDHDDINQLNILILIIFEKVLSSLFNENNYKTVWPISSARKFSKNPGKAIFVFSIKSSTNEKCEILVKCHAHRLHLTKFDTICDIEKANLMKEYNDLLIGNFINDILIGLEYNMKTRGDKVVQSECIYNRNYKEQSLEECLKTITELKHVLLEEIKIKSPRIDFWNDHNQNIDINFNDIKLFLDTNTEKAIVVFQNIHSKQEFFVNLNLSFFMQYPAVYSESDHVLISKTEMLNKYVEVKTLFKVYFYKVLNINCKPFDKAVNSWYKAQSN